MLLGLPSRIRRIVEDMKTGDKAHAIAEYEQVLRTIDADPRVSEAAKGARRSRAADQLTKLRGP